MKVGASIVGKTLHAYFEDFQFGVGSERVGEAILHVVNGLVECQGDVVGISMLLVDFQNGFNLVDIQCPSLAPWVEFCHS